MRVLGVVLYVAVLLCFFNNAFASLDCGDNGWKSVVEAHENCVCNSGYEGTACDSILPEDCESREVSATTATDFPVLDPDVNATTFKNNHLKTNILSPYVAGRIYHELNFTGATSSRCSIGTYQSYWTQSANCSDKFALDLPWTDHQFCGFKNNTDRSDSEKLVITGHLWIKYEDLIDEIDGFNLTRRVSVPYSMSVTFQKNIEVQLLALNITSDVKFGVALTGDEYNPENRVLTLELTTIINFPNAFHPKFTDFYHPDHVDVIPGVLPNLQSTIVDVVPSILGDNSPGAPKCDLGEGPCRQTWTINVTIDESADANETCTFDGDYAIRFRLYTCRGQDSTVSDYNFMCTWTYAFVNFTLASSDVCGHIEVKPDVHGQLLAFPDTYDYADIPNSLGSNVQSFKLGQYAKFYADIQSDGNTIYLTFNDVKFAVKPASGDVDDIAEEDWTYIWQNGAIAATEHIANVHFESHDTQKAFRLYFHSSVFKVLPEETVTYVISANATVVFDGNQGETKKRTVQYTYEASAMETAAKVGLRNTATKTTPTSPSDVTGSETGVSPVTFIASVVGAVAGTLIIVFVVVGFALRTRSQAQKRDAPASAAVSAANAAAATIEVAVNRA